AFASAEAGVSGQPEMIPATSAESAGETAGNASVSPTISPNEAHEKPETHGSSPCIGAREAYRPATYGKLVTAGETAPNPEKATVATQGEATDPTSAEREDRAAANAGGDDVARSATRAGLEDPALNT